MVLSKLRRRHRRRAYTGPPRVLAYVRVSTDEQGDNGYGLDAQRAAIEREAVARDWQELRWITDAGESGKSLDRPGLQEALELLERGEADVLVVSKLDRLSRSVHDFSGLTARALSEGWSLRILDLGLDMTTPQGELMANVLATFAQFERRMIGERTKAALAVKKAAGVRLGRPRVLPEDVRRRIVEMRESGLSYPAIAARLNEEKVPTARGGGRWWPSAVQAIVKAP